jgi:membrane protease YdiL (CAAX protease family)
MAFLALLTSFLVAGAGGALVLGLSGQIDDPSAAVNLVAIVIQDAALVGVALGFAAMVARPRPSQFGLVGTPFWRALGLAVLTVIAFIVLSQLFLTAVGADTKDELPQDLGIDEGTAAAIGIAFAVTVLAPLVEEFFFRGYLYSSFRAWGVPAATLIVGVLFGAVHAGGSDVAFLLPLGLLGGLLCLLRERTGSLYPCIGVHWFNNCMALSASAGWGWQVPVLFAASGLVIVLVLLAVRRLEPPAWRPALRDTVRP